MSGDICTDRPFFGGAITTVFSSRFQEVYVDPSRDESFVFELLEFKHNVSDEGSVTWFLQDLAMESQAEGTVCSTFRRSSATITTAVGQMAISKARQSREAQNIVKVYLANIRLKVVETDVLITAYEPLFINPLSESAAAVGAGLQVPSVHSGCKPIAELSYKLPSLVSKCMTGASSVVQLDCKPDYSYKHVSD